MVQVHSQNLTKTHCRHVLSKSYAFHGVSTTCSRQAYGITRFPWQQQPPTSISKIFPKYHPLNLIYCRYYTWCVVWDIYIYCTWSSQASPPNLLNLITFYTSCSPEWQWCWHTYRWPRRLNPPHGSRRCSSSSLEVSPVQTSFPRSIFPAQTPRDGSWWLMMVDFSRPQVFIQRGSPTVLKCWISSELALKGSKSLLAGTSLSPDVSYL